MADPISYDDFAKLELRVAKVLEARPHPNADKLLLLQVDVGDQQKQIVAGIRQHYTPEQLVGKLIVIVNNLAPAMLRGETSNGMLLAATSGEKVIVLTPDDPECVAGREDQVRPRRSADESRRSATSAISRRRRSWSRAVLRRLGGRSARAGRGCWSRPAAGAPSSRACSQADPAPARLIGIEIQEAHCRRRPGRSRRGRSDPRVQILHANLFDLDLGATCLARAGPLLVVGNPPWVTNAALGRLGERQPAAQANVKGAAGARRAHRGVELRHRRGRLAQADRRAGRPERRRSPCSARRPVARAVLEHVAPARAAGRRGALHGSTPAAGSARRSTPACSGSSSGPAAIADPRSPSSPTSTDGSPRPVDGVRRRPARSPTSTPTGRSPSPTGPARSPGGRGSSTTPPP